MMSMYLSDRISISDCLCRVTVYKQSRHDLPNRCQQLIPTCLSSPEIGGNIPVVCDMHGSRNVLCYVIEFVKFTYFPQNNVDFEQNFGLDPPPPKKRLILGYIP